jgi:streptogramin lyase
MNAVRLVAAVFVMLTITTAVRSQTIYVSNGDARNVVKYTNGVPSTFATGFGTVGMGLALDKVGNLFVADYGNGEICEFTPGAVRSTFATLNHADQLAFDSAGNLYASTGVNGTIMQYTPAGVGSLFASGLSFACGIAFDPAGNLYVSEIHGDRITKITPGGAESTFASVSWPLELAFDSQGNLYAASSDTNSIVKITPGGAESIFASGLHAPIGLAFDSVGDLFVTNQGYNSLMRFTPGGVGTFYATTGLSYPGSLAIVTPEPATLSLLALGGAAMLRRRGT